MNTDSGSRTGLLGRDWQALIHSEDRDRVVKETQRYLETRDKVYNVDYRVSGKEGALPLGQFSWASRLGSVRQADTDGRLVDRYQRSQEHWTRS